MRYFSIFLVLFLVGCEEEIYIETEEKTGRYLVTGQSNAVLCDWSYLEDIAGFEVDNIAVSGMPIMRLIDELDTNIIKQYEGIIFVHGEADSGRQTDPIIYTHLVESYRKLISELTGKDTPLLISLVGYSAPERDAKFDRIRDAVKLYSVDNTMWEIVSEAAPTFRDRGLLKEDGLHYTEKGCKEIMGDIVRYTGV